MSHRFETPDYRGSLLCRCDTVQTTNKQGRVAKHDGCAFSGKVLTPSAIDKRQIAMSARLHPRSTSPFTARALGIIK